MSSHYGRFVSAVPRVAGTRFVQIREDLLKITESKAVCAALLDQLIYFADISDWQPFEKSFPDLEKAIMWMRCQKTIREQVLPKLEEFGFISYQKDQGQETVITVNLKAINEALYKAYPSQPQPRKNFQSTQEELPEHSGKTSGVESGPSLLSLKDSKNLKDSPLPPKGETADSKNPNVNDNGAEIVSFLHDQAVKHGVKFSPTGKQKDWLRETCEDVRGLALQVMATHRGQRINVVEAIMAAAGYSGRPTRSPQGGSARGSGASRQYTPRASKPNPMAKFEASIRQSLIDKGEIDPSSTFGTGGRVSGEDD